MVTKHNHTLTPVILSFSDQIASGIYLFGFKREFEFKAGQVVGIALQEDGPRRLADQEAGDTIWIATGTGLAPFYSMLKSGLITSVVVLQNRTGGFFPAGLQST